MKGGWRRKPFSAFFKQHHFNKIPMSPEIAQRLADFEQRHKPDSKTYLTTFREEVVHLHFKGYSLRATFKYLVEQGVGCSLTTFERWVRQNIDFTTEECPESAKRKRPWPAEYETAGEGAGEGGSKARRRVGQVANQPLTADDAAGFSLAGAASNAPALQPGGSATVAPAPANLPKHIVLVDERGEGDIHSDTETPPSNAKAVNREEALRLAREEREKGFTNPVERALGKDRGK